MRLLQASALAIGGACVAHGARPDGGEGVTAAAPTAPSCHCVPATGGRNPAFDCAAAALPPAARLCQRGQSGLHCALAGEDTQVFTGVVACDPGFCVSEDGQRCLVSCGCDPPPG